MTLTGRSFEIYRRRLFAHEPVTLRELGEMFGVNKERVRQCEMRLLDNLVLSVFKVTIATESLSPPIRGLIVSMIRAIGEESAGLDAVGSDCWQCHHPRTSTEHLEHCDA